VSSRVLHFVIPSESEESHPFMFSRGVLRVCRLLLVCHSEGESPKNLILKFGGVLRGFRIPPQIWDPSLEFTLSEANVLRMTPYFVILHSFPCVSKCEARSVILRRRSRRRILHSRVWTPSILSKKRSFAYAQDDMEEMEESWGGSVYPLKYEILR